MATYFAEIDANGIVLRVIVADQKFIDSGAVGEPKNWIETDVESKYYAGVGYSYDPNDRTFSPPAPYPSWPLDKQENAHVPPKPYPVDGKRYKWDESKIDWSAVAIDVADAGVITP